MEGPDHFISYPRLYEQFGLLKSNGRFYTKDALTVWTNLGKHFVVRLVLRPKYIKTGTRRIMRPDKLPFVVRSSRRISKESSSRRIISMTMR